MMTLLILVMMTADGHDYDDGSRQKPAAGIASLVAVVLGRLTWEGFYPARVVFYPTWVHHHQWSPLTFLKLWSSASFTKLRHAL